MAIISAGIIFLSSFLGYLLFLNHVDINEIGIAYDSRTGHLSKQEAGWHVTPPYVRVTYVSTIPFRVDLQTQSRFILPKLVQFQPEYFEDYAKTEGFHYTMGSPYEFVEYAFSGKEWTFLKEIK